jgi:peptide/nickel transport system substrate-binding protein
MDAFLRTPLTRPFLVLLAAGLVGLAACMPGQPAGSGQPGGQVADRSASATVHLGAFGEPQGLSGVEGAGAGGGGDLGVVAGSALTLVDHDANLIPMLAERIPSLDDGTWVVNPDGTMRLTWHLRRNAKWHDGHPFTTKDVLFSWQFSNDPSLPLRGSPFAEHVTAIEVIDDYTFVAHWKVWNNQAQYMTTTELRIHPAHIVRPLWETQDMQSVLAHPYFHQEFVGLGPYRIERWESDGTIVFKRFDDFFLGPPKIGTLVHHPAGNSTGVLTMLLAGTIHRTSRDGLGFDEGIVARDEWEAKGEGIIYFVPVGFRRINLNVLTQPLFRDVRIRRALLMAIDREQLTKILFDGTAPIAHVPLAPGEPGYAATDRAATKYPLDPRGALALFEQAGWRRGPDGALANAAGERFEFPFRVPVADNEELRIQGAVAGFWKDIGVSTRIENATQQQLRDREWQHTFPGASTTDAGPTLNSLSRRWHSSTIPRAENRYAGSNSAYWSNPNGDRILRQLDNTFRLQDMDPVLADFARVWTDDLPALPLYYTPEVTAAYKYLTGARPRPGGSGQNTWNWSCFKWEWTGP